MTVDKIVNAFRGRGAKVDAIILFGSRAGGRAARDSDIDLAIVSPYFKDKNIFQRQIFLGEIKWETGEIIDPLGYTKKEFLNSSPGTFLSEIKRTGKIVYRGK